MQCATEFEGGNTFSEISKSGTQKVSLAKALGPTGKTQGKTKGKTRINPWEEVKHNRINWKNFNLKTNEEIKNELFGNVDSENSIFYRSKNKQKLIVDNFLIKTANIQKVYYDENSHGGGVLSTCPARGWSAEHVPPRSVPVRLSQTGAVMASKIHERDEYTKSGCLIRTADASNAFSVSGEAGQPRGSPLRRPSTALARNGCKTMEKKRKKHKPWN